MKLISNKDAWDCRQACSGILAASSVLVFCLSQGDPVFKFKLFPSIFLTRIYYWPCWGLPNVVQHCIACYLHFLYSISSQTLLHLLHYSQSRCRNSQHVAIWGPGVHDKHQEERVKSFWILSRWFFNRLTVTTLPETNSEFPPENGRPLKVRIDSYWKPAIFRGFCC